MNEPEVEAVKDAIESLAEPAPEAPGPDISSIEDALAVLRRSEDDWVRLERSEAGQLLKAAWLSAKPLLVPMAGKGAAMLFAHLAGRISDK